jgi:membrane protein required for colicin V production
MNGFDIGLLVFMGVLVVIGLAKGLVRILVGFAALVTAFLVACFYHEPLASYLARLDLPDEVVYFGSYVLLFVAVMLVGGLVAMVLRKLMKAAMLSWADRMAGAALGLAVALLAAALLVVPVVAYMPNGERLLGGSRLAPYVAAVADLAIQVAPEDFYERYREGIEALRDHWRGRSEEWVTDRQRT